MPTTLSSNSVTNVPPKTVGALSACVPLRATLIVFIACGLAGVLTPWCAAAEATSANRPAWDPVRPGEEPAKQSAEETRPDKEDSPASNGQPESRESIAQVRAANRPHVPVQEVSISSQEQIQPIEEASEYEIRFGDPVAGYLPPEESLSFDVGTACPPLVSEPREYTWFDAEYLQWWSQGHFVPALVTTGTTASLGVMDDFDTEVLYGASGLNGGSNSGVRLDLGWWLTPEWALEGNALWMADGKATYDVSSTGDPLLARPFMNVVTGDEDSHVVALTGTVTGALAISSTSRFKGAELLVRRTIHSRSDRRLDAGDSYGFRWDVLLGYRYNQLDDDLLIQEAIETAGQTTIELYDSFEGNNDFHGVDMGLNALFRHNRWSLELLGKMALGNTRSRIWIDGATVTTSGGVVDNDLGGMLALTTNMGNYTQNNMAVIPELGVTLGFDFTKRCRATFGYTFIYWSKVARAGSQIDRNLNPSYFANNGPATGAVQPEFTFVMGDYWTQGMNFGLELHF